MTAEANFPLPKFPFSSTEMTGEDSRRPDLADRIAGIHEEHGLSFPLDKPAGRPENSLGLLRNRSGLLAPVRTETARLLLHVFGPDSDEASAGLVVASIAPALDRIFLNQLEQKKEPAKSWPEYSPLGVLGLKTAIAVLEKNSRLEGYFRRNVETRQMLHLLKLLASDKIPVNLDLISAAFAKLAVTQAEAQKPTLLFVLSDYYMRPDVVDKNHIEVLEPDIRFILPYKGDRAQLVKQTREIYQQELKKNLPNNVNESFPIIVGDTVMSAGAQLIAYNSGETLEGGGIMLAPNNLRSVKSIRDVFRRAGLTLPANFRTLLIPLYVRHELGHRYLYTDDPYFDELMTDIPATIYYLEHEMKNGDLETAIALVMGENVYGATLHPTGESSTDGYRISATTIINTLLKHRVVDVIYGGKLKINPDKDACRRFIEELKTVHRSVAAGDTGMIAKLREYGGFYPQHQGNE